MPETSTRKPTSRVKPGAVLRELRAGRAHQLSAPECEPEEPSLQVERDGDRIVRITARCSCGREIKIQCDYDGSEE
ncbi:MAG: hypothetical protein V2A76_07020 [Planctomycetota bacterium]